MDFDPEEISKKMSLGLSVGYAHHKDCKINIIDVPGSPDFIGETIVSIPAVENVVLVVNGTAGYEVGLELAIEQLENEKAAKIVLVNRMDNEHADFQKTLDTIYENAGFNPIPVHIPIGKESTFEGVVDVIRQKAILPGGEKDIPADMQSTIAEAHQKLMEAIAETDEELLNDFLEKGELSEEQLINGMRKALANGEICIAFACSAIASINF